MSAVSAIAIKKAASGAMTELMVGSMAPAKSAKQAENIVECKEGPVAERHRP